MKTVRTVRKIVERDEELRQQPQFGIRDYVQIYFGQYEGHHFWIKDVRYNHDHDCFQYLYGGGVMGGWMNERQLVLVRKAEEAA